MPIWSPWCSRADWDTGLRKQRRDLWLLKAAQFGNEPDCNPSIGKQLLKFYSEACDRLSQQWAHIYSHPMSPCFRYSLPHWLGQGPALDNRTVENYDRIWVLESAYVSSVLLDLAIIPLASPGHFAEGSEAPVIQPSKVGL